jgi:uncharacterized protein (TIGR02757 family)
MLTGQDTSSCFLGSEPLSSDGFDLGRAFARRPSLSVSVVSHTSTVELVQQGHRSARLKHYLDRFLDSFQTDIHVRFDPVQFVRRYSSSADREVVGFIAASFAYGNVKSVLKTVEGIVAALGPHPANFVAAFDPLRDGRRFRGFRHRWNNQRDLLVLLWILRRLLEEHGSLELAFLGGARAKGFPVANVLDRFSSEALGFGHEKFYSLSDLRERRGVRYFFPQPSGGSACKRLNLFLRWMVRADDGVDCDVWQRVETDQLIIPLDTHIARIASYIGLTEMRSPGWPMAIEITEALRELDPEDPLRYDFALCHLGIAGDCPKKRNVLKCLHCPIEPICRL